MTITTLQTTIEFLARDVKYGWRSLRRNSGFTAAAVLALALGIGASVAIGFAYFVVNAVLLSYGRSGVLPPLVAAWGANFLFVLGGIWLAMTAKS